MRRKKKKWGNLLLPEDRNWNNMQYRKDIWERTADDKGGSCKLCHLMIADKSGNGRRKSIEITPSWANTLSSICKIHKNPMISDARSKWSGKGNENETNGPKSVKGSKSRAQEVLLWSKLGAFALKQIQGQSIICPFSAIHSDRPLALHLEERPQASTRMG